MKVIYHNENRIVNIGACWELEITDSDVTLYLMAKAFSTSAKLTFPLDFPPKTIMERFNSEKRFYIADGIEIVQD